MKDSEKKFFTKKSSWRLKHNKGTSYIVVFTTEDGLGYAILIYVDGHTTFGEKGSKNVTEKTFTGNSADDAYKEALEWARNNIQGDLTIDRA